MKRILLLTTGGTIASVETAHGLAPAPTNEPLRRLLDELALPCKVDVKSLFHIDKKSLSTFCEDNVTSIFFKEFYSELTFQR